MALFDELAGREAAMRSLDERTQPERLAQHPDRERVEERYEEFRAAG